MKKKLLVFTSTFPRWKNDNLPPFVYELSRRLTKDFDIMVLTPHYPAAKTKETMNKLKVRRFRYFFERYEKLAAGNGILPTLKKNKLYYLEVPLFLIAEFLALRREIKKNKPDIILAHWIIPQGFIAYLNYKISKTPYIVTSHGSDVLGLKGFKNLKKAILRDATKITVVSNAIKQEIVENIDSSLKNKIEVIPMGIDTKLFNPSKKDNSIKKKYNINGPFLLFVGRLAPEKGIDILIEAMPEVIKKFPNAKLLIIGKGILEDELKRRVEELKVKKNIIFVGWVDNKQLPKYYATADLFVCPSRREGSPVSYIEALSCGAPIVVGDIPISREIVKKYGGFIVKQNAGDVASGVVRALGSRTKVKGNFRKDYDWGEICKKFAGVLG